MAPWANEPITMPALYRADELDLAYQIADRTGTLTEMEETVPDLRRRLVNPGCGHWLNQERPDLVNEALLEFFEPTVPR